MSGDGVTGSVASAQANQAPLVSCIVPVFNAERFIVEALQSIRAQSHTNIEIVVVDDGSTDHTADRIASYDAPVRVIRQENQGPAAARNAGIAIASGSFVAFLDADDLWHSAKLERQLQRFTERPELGACFAWFRNIAADPPSHDDPLLNAESWPASPYSPCTLLARRSVFDEVGPFNEALRRGEDTEWFVRLMLRKVPYEVMADILTDRRIHGGNISRDQPQTPDRVLEVLKVVLDRRRTENW